jgi:hypothetical protein
MSHWSLLKASLSWVAYRHNAISSFRGCVYDVYVCLCEQHFNAVLALMLLLPFLMASSLHSLWVESHAAVPPPWTATAYLQPRSQYTYMYDYPVSRRYMFMFFYTHARTQFFTCLIYCLYIHPLKWKLLTKRQWKCIHFDHVIHQ